MTRIQFYVGRSADSTQHRLSLACKLLQKAYAHGLHCYVHCTDTSMVERMDNLLWTFDDISFIPHYSIHTNFTSNASPPSSRPCIIIGCDHTPDNIHSPDYLVNLTNHTPEFFNRFSRMAEILDQTPDILQFGRQRYRFYREQGYSLEYHQL